MEMSNATEEHDTAPETGDATTLFKILKTYPFESHTKIQTQEFLDTCLGVITLIEQLGKAFTPIKYDIEGNINKLQSKFNEDTTAYMYLQDMIIAENRQGSIIATDALQWLRRSLHFFVKFFNILVQDHENNIVDQSLSGQLKFAYRESLEMYHSWLGTQLFSILCKFVPNRKDLYKVFALNKEVEEEQIINDMRTYTNHLDKFVVTLTEFYIAHNLETFYRV